MDKGHWIFDKNFCADDWFGFVYRIIDITTGQIYLGKKHFHKIQRKKVRGRKNRRTIRSPSNWKIYTSSSTHVNKAIEEKGKENFKFIIESLHKTKASLTYAEVEKQIFENVLREKFEDGTPKYHNKMIGAIKFIPPEPTIEECHMKNKAMFQSRSGVR